MALQVIQRFPVHRLFDMDDDKENLLRNGFGFFAAAEQRGAAQAYPVITCTLDKGLQRAMRRAKHSWDAKSRVARLRLDG
ncbi:hypothetical protein [Rhizobium leguminosarum]|uniref:hypothetical protein n=1 Tax=Rhizobium leguminosarum TaxID=384 RepID=UPI00102F4B05|nr:hypothetical protein [Rhizobium leguminosarum]TAY13736.1 hypothetical protein ELH96_19130 [Rhizobium leguminosarum]